MRVIRNLPRDSRLAAWLGRLAGRDAYFIEQLTFFLSFLEVFRYAYLGQPRAFTCTLGVLMVLAIVRLQARVSSSMLVHDHAGDPNPPRAQYADQPAHR